MLRKLGLLIVALGCAAPIWAGTGPSVISGYVRNATGVPQMGAMVEILGPAARALTVFTDENGFYKAAGLLPGMYSLKVSAPSFLPVLRERIGLPAGSNLPINITLSTLFEAIQLAPTRGPSDGDDWKWVLRSGANRPILRMIDDHNAVLTTESHVDNRMKGTLSFVAGGASGGYGSASDVGTGFSLQRGIFASDLIGLQGNFGYGTAAPTSVLRASFSHQVNGSAGPQAAFTFRSLAAPDTMPGVGLQSASLTTSDGMALGDVVELRFGSELQTVQFLGRVTAFRPFGTVDVHLPKNTTLEYRYATSVPDSSIEGESPDIELIDSAPRVSMMNYTSTIENAHHHELSISHKSGKNRVEAAVYYDRITDPALTGVGEVTPEGGNVLADAYSSTFTYRGAGYSTQGVRLVAERQVFSNLTATFDFAYGGALALSKANADLQDARQAMESTEHRAVAGKLSGVIPKSKTHWAASYRWVDGQVLTPVDMFNTSAGRADPYLDIFLRQPIPGVGFLPGHIEAIIDVRNLLAQGYVPVMGQDRHTVYLVQAAKAVRGGVSFTF